MTPSVKDAFNLDLLGHTRNFPLINETLNYLSSMAKMEIRFFFKPDTYNTS